MTEMNPSKDNNARISIGDDSFSLYEVGHPIAIGHQTHDV